MSSPCQAELLGSARLKDEPRQRRDSSTCGQKPRWAREAGIFQLVLTGTPCLSTVIHTPIITIMLMNFCWVPIYHLLFTSVILENE